MVAAPDAEAVLRDLAALDRLAGYVLRGAPDRRIRDRHLDTPDGRLARRGIALRLREQDGARWLSLKGPARGDTRGPLSRPQTERPWSERTLARALADLDLGAAAADLVTVQERETYRQVREVAAETQAAPLAELALDTVTYRLRRGVARHREVEIEATSRPGAVQAVLAVTDALEQRYPGCLRRGLPSKLAIGLALQQLQDQGALDALLDPSGHLTPAAYDLLF